MVKIPRDPVGHQSYCDKKRDRYLKAKLDRSKLVKAIKEKKKDVYPILAQVKAMQIDLKKVPKMPRLNAKECQSSETLSGIRDRQKQIAHAAWYKRIQDKALFGNVNINTRERHMRGRDTSKPGVYVRGEHIPLTHPKIRKEFATKAMIGFQKYYRGNRDRKKVANMRRSIVPYVGTGDDNDNENNLGDFDNNDDIENDNFEPQGNLGEPHTVLDIQANTKKPTKAQKRKADLSRSRKRKEGSTVTRRKRIDIELESTLRK